MKEYYFYLDSTPTHSYMKYLYKYPQAAYPYADLVDTNRRRSKDEMEYELLDTGVFEEDRYFDIFVEYAKDGPEASLCESVQLIAGRRRQNCNCCPHYGSGTIGRHGLPNQTGLLRNQSSSRSRQARARVRLRRRIRCWVN